MKTPSAPSLALDVVRTPALVTGAGAVVEHVVTVTNSGRVPVDDLRVPVEDGDGRPLGTASCAPTDGPLLPGAQVRCTWTLRTAGADVTRGSVAVSFVATGVGVDLGDDVASGVVTVDTAVDPTPAAAPSVGPTPTPAAEPAGDAPHSGRLALTGAALGPAAAAALALLLAGIGTHRAVHRRVGRDPRDASGATR